MTPHREEAPGLRPETESILLEPPLSCNAHPRALLVGRSNEDPFRVDGDVRDNEVPGIGRLSK